MSGIFGERAKEAVLSLLFPRRCPVCGEIVMPKGQRICPPCVKQLDFVREPRCMKCGRSIDEEASRYCHSCETRERHFERNLALLFYDDRMRRAMAAVKYHHKKEYLAPLGHLLALKFSESSAALGRTACCRFRCTARGGGQGALIRPKSSPWNLRGKSSFRSTRMCCSAKRRPSRRRVSGRMRESAI